jgi:hypothetical protein
MDPTIRFFAFLIIALITPTPTWSCTIFCAKDSHGHVWTGNNEDARFSLGTKANVVTKTDSTLGFIWYNYENNRYAQGGINEAGLFYDLNAVPPSDIKNVDQKTTFPGVNIEDFYLYLLGHCKTVPEVIEFYSKYKMPWMTTAQMNVADKQGNLGIINADSAWILNANYSISTNYNLSHPDRDNITCWRYPIADEILLESEPNFETFTKICDATSQRKIFNTIFSSICNLNTGELWFYYAWDYENPHKTTLQELLAMGDTVLMMRDWFPERKLVKAYHSYIKYDFNTASGVLDEIDDPQMRADMLKLLSIDMLAGSTKDRATNELVAQIIDASNDVGLLRWLNRMAATKENRELAVKKIRSIQMANVIDNALFWPIMIGGLIILLLAFLKKRNKRQLIKNQVHQNAPY